MAEADKIQILADVSGAGLVLCMAVLAVISSRDIELIERGIKLTNTLVLLVDIRPSLWMTTLYYAIAEVLVILYLNWSSSPLYKLTYLLILLGTLITLGLVGYFTIRLWLLR